MEKHTEVAVLLDIYGELLTPKQKNVMSQYYYYDLSLQEIAENEGITRQGVHDLIKRSEYTLYDTDEKLQIKAKLHSIQVELDNLSMSIDDLNSLFANDDKAIYLINSCKEQIKGLKTKVMGV